MEIVRWGKCPGNMSDGGNVPGGNVPHSSEIMVASARSTTLANNRPSQLQVTKSRVCR